MSPSAPIGCGSILREQAPVSDVAPKAPPLPRLVAASLVRINSARPYVNEARYRSSDGSTLTMRTHRCRPNEDREGSEWICSWLQLPPLAADTEGSKVGLA
jgi:hypothetical protein